MNDMGNYDTICKIMFKICNCFIHKREIEKLCYLKKNIIIHPVCLHVWHI